jgi:hypothetical protein
VKKLEEELDVKIFERGGNEVSVTPLGEALVRQAQVVIEQAAWIGASGLLLGIAGAAAALWMASRNDVPIAVEVLPSLACALLVLCGPMVILMATLSATSLENS